MDSNILILLILFFSPVLLLASHIVIIRIVSLFNRKFSGQLLALTVALFLNIVILGIIYFIKPDLNWLIYSFIVYNSIAYSYFHLYNLSETARRISIMIEVKDNVQLNRNHFKEYYNANYQIERRLERLTAMNQIKYENNRYIITGKLLWVASIIIYNLRKLYGFVK